MAVQVGEEEARLLNLETLPAGEVEKLRLEGLSIWYFESNERIVLAETEVKLVDKKTGEALEELKFE